MTSVVNKMFYGLIREDPVITPNKKPLKKDLKENKKKDANAPDPMRIPLPSVPELIQHERRATLKESQKKTKLTADSPPSVCLYTVLNGFGGVSSAHISENAAQVAIGYGNSMIQLYALGDDYLKVLKSPEKLQMIDTDMDEISEEMYEENEKPKSIQLYGHQGPVYDLSFSCERRMLISASRDTTVRLWNVEMKRNLAVYRLSSPVWQAKFSNRGYYFATASAEQSVMLWCTERIQPLRIFSESNADVSCLDFHPNCNYIIGGGDDKLTRIWDVLSGTVVRTFGEDNNGAVKSVKFSPDGRYVVTVNEDGVLSTWDLAGQKLLAIHECQGITTSIPIAFSRDSSAFAVATPYCGVTFYSMDTITLTSGGGGGGQHNPGETKINPDGFAMFSYPTKKTPIIDLQFHKKNVVIGVGAYDQ